MSTTSYSEVLCDKETFAPIRSHWMHSIIGEADAVYKEDSVEIKAAELVRLLALPHLASGSVAPRPYHGINVLRQTVKLKRRSRGGAQRSPGPRITARPPGFCFAPTRATPLRLRT